MVHTEAMLDPATGIAVSCEVDLNSTRSRLSFLRPLPPFLSYQIVGGTQLFDGSGDKATRNVWADLERAVYAGLE